MPKAGRGISGRLAKFEGRVKFVIMHGKTLKAYDGGKLVFEVELDDRLLVILAGEMIQAHLRG